MNNKITLVVLMGLISFGCNQEKDIEFLPESFTETELSMCQDGNCPEITINYIEISGNEAVSEKINQKIRDFIFNSLLMGEDTVPTAISIEEAATDFVEAYNADKAQFPDLPFNYVADISVQVIYSSKDHLCFEMRNYLFTGGAHGYGTTSFLNIDPQTGSVLSSKELFKNNTKFTAFAEEKFRAQEKIPKDFGINDTGFWFENNTFYLPENAGFTQDSLIFVYNQYDITSYAEGPIELKIAIKEAAPFLAID